MTMHTEQVPVLDKGFVRLVKSMASDQDVLDAARVSYKSESKGPEADAKLVRYLIEHDHGTPFEHAVFKFHVKAPIFVARQWFRHRTSSYNETSFRYREAPEEFYVPDKWRVQDSKNKQGSVAGALDHEEMTAMLASAAEGCMDYYRIMVNSGVAREMARMVLPVNLYTEWYWTVNARALMHFIRLRSEHHAQWEMRQYSNAIWPIFARAMPWTAAAFLGTLNLAKYAALDGIAGPNVASIPSETQSMESLACKECSGTMGHYATCSYWKVRA
jgi:thymidylate synthase (FAD)